MEWIEFLNDPELKAQAALYGMPNGENLCKKVMHDSLECLNTYKECAKIVFALHDELDPQTRQWFAKWTPAIERWVSEINSLAKQGEELPTESLAWSNVITQIGDVVEQASALEIESQVVEIPNTGVGRKVIQIAIRVVESLNLLRHDIISHDYKRLWTIRKYGDSIEGK